MKQSFKYSPYFLTRAANLILLIDIAEAFGAILNTGHY